MFAPITQEPRAHGAQTLNNSNCRTSQRGGQYVPCSSGPHRSRPVYAFCQARLGSSLRRDIFFERCRPRRTISSRSFLPCSPKAPVVAQPCKWSMTARCGRSAPSAGGAARFLRNGFAGSANRKKATIQRASGYRAIRCIAPDGSRAHRTKLFERNSR